MTLFELQCAIDQYAIACWFNQLSREQRHWENRQNTGDLVIRTRTCAISRGANAEQIADCEQYARKLAFTNRTPVALSGRSWDQFVADTAETC